VNQEVDTVHVPDKEERTWGMVCHLVVFTGYIIPLGHLDDKKRPNALC